MNIGLETDSGMALLIAYQIAIRTLGTENLNGIHLFCYRVHFCTQHYVVHANSIHQIAYVIPVELLNMIQFHIKRNGKIFREMCCSKRKWKMLPSSDINTSLQSLSLRRMTRTRRIMCNANIFAESRNYASTNLLRDTFRLVNLFGVHVLALLQNIDLANWSEASECATPVIWAVAVLLRTLNMKNTKWHHIFSLNRTASILAVHVVLHHNCVSLTYITG